MKRSFVLLLVLAIALPSFSTTPQQDGEKELSPFVGKWGWEGNALEHRFFVWCGERNDSLLFTIGGTFFYGDRIHMPEHAKNGDFIQMVRVKKPKGNIARSKTNALFIIDLFASYFSLYICSYVLSEKCGFV